MMPAITMPVSVVIATLGGPDLRETIETLNSGEVPCAEILICIPEAEAPRAALIEGGNVKVVPTKVRGQVAQRAVGLSIAKEPYVMQLDDDIILEERARLSLLAVLSEIGGGSAVAPLYINRSTGTPMHAIRRGMRGLWDSVLATVICGAPFGDKRIGRLAPVGFGYGVDPKRCKSFPVEVDWLPGGCVICRKEDLVTESYYPFSGKAFAEDVIHSILWTRKGVRLWVTDKATCATAIENSMETWAQFQARWLAHRYVAGMIGAPKWRVELWGRLTALRNFKKIRSVRNGQQ